MWSSNIESYPIMPALAAAPIGQKYVAEPQTESKALCGSSQYNVLFNILKASPITAYEEQKTNSTMLWVV